jgi:hypothetical protein
MWPFCKSLIIKDAVFQTVEDGSKWKPRVGLLCRRALASQMQSEPRRILPATAFAANSAESGYMNHIFGISGSCSKLCSNFASPFAVS